MRFRHLWLSLPLLVSASHGAAAASWSNNPNDPVQYSIDLPDDSFALQESVKGHRTLSERAGNAILDVYSGSNTKGLSPAQFIEQLSRASRIADVTYRAIGRSWFVISGHYRRETGDPGMLIYYAKFVFSPDLSRFAAFEISYSTAEKARMDPVVTRLEKTLRFTR